MTQKERDELMCAAKQRLLFVAVVVVMLLIAGLFGKKANAKTVEFGSSIMQLKIEYPGATILRFPKPVQTITGAGHFEIKPASETDPTYTVLSVTPKTSSGNFKVSFFLSDGSVVRAKIQISPKDGSSDNYYELKSQDSVDGGSGGAPAMSEIELLKAMVLDATPAGYKVSQLSDEKSSKAGARIELIRIYRGSPYNGYIYKVTNESSKKSVDIDVRHITVGDPNLAILAQSDEAVLQPKGKGVSQTFVRIVAKNTASSGDVILAMESDASLNPDKKGEKPNEHE